jgi:hypothetical protein
MAVGGEWVVLGVEPFGPLDCAVEIFCGLRHATYGSDAR